MAEFRIEDLDQNHPEFEDMMNYALKKWEFGCLYNAPTGHRMVSHDYPSRHPLWIGPYTVEFSGIGYCGLRDSLNLARERGASVPVSPLDYVMGHQELEAAVWEAAGMSYFP